jgi:glycosyltransferase involved in cell wall biosynthesis
MHPGKPRVVVAGQVPPPYGGQNIMIQKAVAQFATHPNCESIHLPFFFTPDFQTARTGSFRKALELVRVIGRLLRIRMKGPIDLFLYPTGGPQTVPIIRDILLLPWILLLSRRVVLHFHAAGIADRFSDRKRHPLYLLISTAYSRAFAAIVMTEFNRRDPTFFNIKNVLVQPHRIDDEFDPSLVKRGDGSGRRLLYVGHLCADKGTDQLLRAFAAIRKNHPDLKLELVGECLPPFTPEQLSGLLDELQIASDVKLSGVLTGREKWEAFGRADLFVFPTIAPYESFGVVLVEAMIWRLPIVASRWRGNLDVLTSRAGGVCFSISPFLERDIKSALQEALDQQSNWAEWGAINRAIFEQHYKASPDKPWLAEAVFSILPTRAKSE